MRFPEFKGEWENTSLGKIGKTFNGLTGKSGSDFGQGFPYITYKSIFDDSKIDISRVEYVEITDVERKKETQNKVQYGDVFFTTSSETPDEVGMSSVLLDEIKDCYLNSFCFGYRLNSLSKTTPEYMRFYLRSQTIRKKMFVLAQGSTRFNISKSEVMGMPINIPEIEEQRKIANLLTLLDDRIATQNKIIEKLQSLIKGLIDDIITLGCGQLVAFETLYSKAGEGGTPTTSNTEFYDNGNIPFIKIDDLSNKYLSTNKDYITELGLNKSSAWLIPTHSIIYSNGATIGAISINKYPVCTKQGILGIVPNTNIDVEFLYYFMQSSYFQKEVERVVTEGTMKTAYLKDINHIKCPIPDLDRQKEISHLLSVLSLKKDVERQLLQKYQIQKQYLLSQMFI